MSEARWYIVQVRSGFEQKVVEMIQLSAEKAGFTEFISDVIVPSEVVMELKKGKRVASNKKIFPGYIMVRMVMTDALWAIVKGTPGVVNMLGSMNKPKPISDEEAERVLSYGDEGSIPDVSGEVFSVGENVRIIDGLFETFSGVVDNVDDEKRRLKISVFIFGRSTPVELDYHQVEKIV